MVLYLSKSSVRAWIRHDSLDQVRILVVVTKQLSRCLGHKNRLARKVLSKSRRRAFSAGSLSFTLFTSLNFERLAKTQKMDMIYDSKSNEEGETKHLNTDYNFSSWGNIRSACRIPKSARISSEPPKTASNLYVRWNISVNLPIPDFVNPRPPMTLTATSATL